MKQKIMFFDIDGTLLPEGVPGAEVSESTINSIQQARANGHLMFINTGRCMQNIEPRFLNIGFDGVVAGCGTNIYYDGKELFHAKREPAVCKEVIEAARVCRADIIYEAKERMACDPRIEYDETTRQFIRRMELRGYDLKADVDRDDFVFDKFVIWAHPYCRLQSFLGTVGEWFEIIPRGGIFYEFVPKGYSKATGIQFLLDHFSLPLKNAYAVGDSMNDLPMLDYVPGSIAMGNSHPDLFSRVSYVTKSVEENGIETALRHFGFID